MSPFCHAQLASDESVVGMNNHKFKWKVNTFCLVTTGQSELQFYKVQVGAIAGGLIIIGKTKACLFLSNQLDLSMVVVCQTCLDHIDPVSVRFRNTIH